MIPTYAASSSTSAWDNFTIPSDDKIIVSVHAYTPYDFTLNINRTSQWNPNNSADTGAINYLMDSLNQYFISKGHPVILGEFGAMNKNNLSQRTDWAYYYVKAAKAKGIPCIWWDNGAVSGSGELFGLLDRLRSCALYLWQKKLIKQIIIICFISFLLTIKSRNYPLMPKT